MNNQGETEAAAGNGDEIRQAVKSRLDRPLVLIGLMGVGKTRIGKLLARELGLRFSDCDSEIEKAAGCSITEIFERFGEDSFRDAEKKIVSRLIDEGVQVIATGGGSVMNPETADRIWKDAISIWLRADVPLMVERTSRSRTRPLLNDRDPQEVFSRLKEVRYPVYGKANIIVDSTDNPPPKTMSIVMEKLNAWLDSNET